MQRGTSGQPPASSRIVQTDFPPASRPMEESSEEYYSTLKEGHSDRQVVLRSGLQPFHPCIMETIQISIVNDQLPRNKRGQENLKVGTPKRLRSAVFRCSTPCSSSAHLQNHPHFPLIEVAHPSGSGSDNKLDNEWDDSLLDPSSGEEDSPLYLTVDEIESLLEDDSCYAAEAPCSDRKGDSKQTVIQLRSETCEIETEHPSTPEEPPMTVEVESEKETTNYAVMAPCSGSSTKCSPELCEFTGISNSSNPALMDSSPCNSALVKVTVVNEPKKPVRSSTVPETEVALECPSTSAWPAELLNPPQMDLDLLEFDCEGSELSFDGDIDDLLALSPGEITSDEDDDIPLLTSAVRHEMGCGKSGSKTLALPMESLQPHCSLTAANSNSKASGSVTFSCNSPAPESSGEHTGADASSQEREVHDIKTNNPTIKTEPQTASENEDNQTCQTTSSTAVDQQAIQKSSTQKVFTPVDLKPLVTVAPVKPKVKKAAPRLPHPVFRPRVNSFLVDEKKEQYLGHVMMHLEGPSTSGDPQHELTLLLNQISRDNPNWQHPSNFTRRNHPRFERRPTKCSLSEWVFQNGDSRQRFQGLPSTFQRSPIPEFLPPRPF